ncbi:MAG TPA: YaaR family protein [Pseudothermotoga sp.]|nr:YaaR family protein [Pseudothermotoga sp.]HOK83512.1 YaaR family protein [Pseudothermotoga sp.]HPP69585.1 YaaR family protein [Pseudothermotoga sp.]
MRINPLEDGNFKSSEVKRKKQIKSKALSEISRSGFFEILEDVEEEKIDELLEDLIKKVVNTGNELVRSPTQENFKNYRESIKEFLKLIEKRLYKVGRQLSNDIDLHVVAREINQRLEQIAKDLIEAEKGAIMLAAKVQEIYGLLMDLYR